MLNQKFIVAKFIRWFAEKYIELEKKALPYPCKIYKIATKKNEYIVTIALSGHSSVIDVELRKIIDQHLFEYFSPTDKIKLFSLIENPQKLIVADHFFCNEEKSEMVTLADKPAGKRMTISAATLSTNNQLLEKLSSLDAHKIGYITGVEYLRRIIE